MKNLIKNNNLQFSFRYYLQILHILKLFIA